MAILDVGMFKLSRSSRRWRIGSVQPQDGEEYLDQPCKFKGATTKVVVPRLGAAYREGRKFAFVFMEEDRLLQPPTLNDRRNAWGYMKDLDGIGINQNYMYMCNRKYLSVTEIVSVHWCSKQVAYRYCRPDSHLEPPSMRRGRNIHSRLEAQVHQAVNVPVQSRADNLAVLLIDIWCRFQQLYTTGIAREISVYGQLKDVWVRGVVDQLELHTDPNTGEVTVKVIDFKTRQKNTVPPASRVRSSMLQIHLYRDLLIDFQTLFSEERFPQFLRMLEIDPEAPLSAIVRAVYQDALDTTSQLQSQLPKAPWVGGNLAEKGNVVWWHSLLKRSRVPKAQWGKGGGDEGGGEIELTQETITLGMLREMLHAQVSMLPRVQEDMLLAFIYQNTLEPISWIKIKHSSEFVEQVLNHSIQFWQGYRPARGLQGDEKVKCRTCDFRGVCHQKIEVVVNS